MIYNTPVKVCKLCGTVLTRIPGDKVNPPVSPFSTVLVHPIHKTCKGSGCIIGALGWVEQEKL